MHADIDKYEIPALNPGDLVDATVLQVDHREVTVSAGPAEGVIPLSEFKAPPAVGTVLKVVVKQQADEAREGQMVFSKREADQVFAWQILAEHFENQMPMEGTLVKAMENGYHVAVDWGKYLPDSSAEFSANTLFLPKSHLGRLPGGRKEAEGARIAFKIIELQKAPKFSAIVSHKQLQDEASEKAWAEFSAKHATGDVVDCKVYRAASFGVFLDLDGVQGLLPASEVSWRRGVKFAKQYPLGSTVTAKILKIENENRQVTFSIKQLTEDPWLAAERVLEAGQDVAGTVRAVYGYGAFLEIDGFEGVNGLIRQQELSWAKRPVKPQDVVKKGQTLTARLLLVDWPTRKIDLGLRQLLPNPWDDVNQHVKVGEIRKGKVTSVADFGAFVEITPELDGLIHVSDVSWDEHDIQPKKRFRRGEELEFKVLAIKPEEKRISCGLKQLVENPFNTIKKKYPPKAAIAGTVSKVNHLGVWVLIEGKYEALVAPDKLPRAREESDADAMAKYKPGDAVNAVVLKVIPEARKVVLSIRDFEYIQNKQAIQPYLSDGQPLVYNPFQKLKESKK